MFNYRDSYFIKRNYVNFDFYVFMILFLNKFNELFKEMIFISDKGWFDIYMVIYV